MRVATTAPLSTRPFAQIAARVRELESAGLDVVLVAEAYSFDAVSRVGYLAAKHDRAKLIDA